MILCTQYESDIKIRIREITFFRGRLLIIAAIVSLLLAAYSLLVGFAGQESEALKMGWTSAILCFACLALFCGIYFSNKKIITTAFQKYAIDGKIEYSIEKTNRETIMITRLCDNKGFEIRKSEIKHIRHLKTVTLFVLTNKRWFDLPKFESINELIET